ncbi:MAG: response regulator transcription factor [Patescibacteria group bacterium]
MRILIIEDEQEIINFLKSCLTAQRYSVDCATDGEKGLYMAKTNQYDVLIVDNMLPKGSGLEVCTELRRSGLNTPIIVLSVVNDSKTKTSLLNAGADDYMTKPFSLDELLARIRAVLRRPKNISGEVMSFDDLRLDSAKHTVQRAKKKIHLTPKEFTLLEYLMQNRSNVVSRGMILEHVWDMDADPFSNTIEAHVMSLRRKIDIEGHHKLIQTVHGLGYKIDTER